MSEYVTPVNQFLKSIDIQPYDRYLPNAFNDSLTMLEKVNKVIQQMNESNQLTNEVVEKWNEFTKWVNTNGIDEPINTKLTELITDGSFQSLITPEIKKQTDEVLKTFNTVLSQNNQKITDITTNVLHLSSYKKLQNETTDDGRFNRLIADLEDGCIVYFEANATYVLTSKKHFNKDNLRIFGCGSKITYNGTDRTDILLFGNTTPKVTATSQNISLTRNNNSITLPDLTNVNIGDIIIVYNPSSTNKFGYCDGVYAEIVEINPATKTIKLSISPHKTFIATNYSVYRSLNNITISDLDVRCNESLKNIAFNFMHVKNSTFSNLSSDGLGGRVGINLQGINCTITKCSPVNFYDNGLSDNRSGYGINVSGHNINVESNDIKKCKHSISAGVREYLSTGINYTKNICYRDPTETVRLQLLDMHANVEGSIENNILHNVAEYGIAIRNDNVKVSNNTLHSVYNEFQPNLLKPIGIWAVELATNNLKIQDNTFHGFFHSVFTLDSTSDKVFENITIDGNKADYGGIFFIANSKNPETIIKHVKIVHNELLGESVIDITNKCGLGVLIDGNTVNTGQYRWNLGVVVNNPDSLPITIKGNTINHGENGGEPIRLYNDWNIISDNILSSSNTSHPINTQGKTNNIKNNNLWIKPDGIMQLA